MKLAYSVSLMSLAIFFSSSFAFGKETQTDLQHGSNILEAFPDKILASKESYNNQLAASGRNSPKLAFYMLSSARRWNPGQQIRIAFKGGNADLYKKIQSAAESWTKQGNANLKFIFTDSKGKYLQWSETDSDYLGDIRIAFNSGITGGFWSHVGTDSINPRIEGGAPNQASMNLDSFDRYLPDIWAAVVLHEFGHALGFEHEHQNPNPGCDFRFEDDAGYVPATTRDGLFIPDSKGRRPGLYTYLGGYPNYWPRQKVDFNLKSLTNSTSYIKSEFDKESIMKYFFEPSMFVNGEKSVCYTNSENSNLSKLDIAGAQKFYPFKTSEVTLIRSQKSDIYKALIESETATQDVKAEASKNLMRIKQLKNGI